MTQNDKDLKELLLKDLCARLPYGVKVKTILKEPYTLKGLSDTEYGGVMGCLLGKYVPNNVSPKTTNYPLEQFKPYLFPLSSMTEEQEVEYDATFATIVYEDGRKDSVMTYKSFDWLNKNNFDYRGLIEKSLALDATNLEIYK